MWCLSLRLIASGQIIIIYTSYLELLKQKNKILPRKLRVHLAPRISVPSLPPKRVENWRGVEPGVLLNLFFSNVCVSSLLRAIKQKRPVLTT